MRLSPVLALAAAGLIACGRDAAAPPPVASPPPLAPPVGESPVDRPFVVFREREFVIGSLEVPVAPPVAVGSRPSPATMSSDAPDVVSVEASGALVAHRVGQTVIRTLHGEGSAIAVRVEVPAESASGPSGVPSQEAPVFGIQPVKARVPRGSVKLFEARGPNGPVVAEWRSKRPEVIAPLAGGLFEARAPGRTSVCARVANRETCNEVEVTP